jgi:hypothetical protein
VSDWREGLCFEDRIDVRLKAENVDPHSPQAFTIACDEWRSYTVDGESPRSLNDIELECTARDTLNDIINKRGQTRP